MFKAKRHPQSLLKEGVSTLRYVEGKETIFQIIMPWRFEKEEEEKKKIKKLKNEAELKQQSMTKWLNLKQSSQEQPQKQISAEE